MSRRRISRDAAPISVPTIWDILQKEKQTIEADPEKLVPPASEEKVLVAEDEQVSKENQTSNGGEAEPLNGPRRYLTQKVSGKETYLLFVGEAKSGKSSAIQSFLHPNKEAEAKPTSALDYTYGRRTTTTGDRKDLAHIWELGGGQTAAELLEVVVTKERLAKLTFVLTVDLSKPDTSILSLVSFISLLKEKTRAVLAAVRSDKEFAEIQQSWNERRSSTLGNRPIPEWKDQSQVPLVILATKYDALRDEEGVMKKMLAQALRYVAWASGATLLYVSRKEKSTLQSMRGVLNHYAFGSDIKRSKQLDSERPIYVTYGSDTIESIKPPPGTRVEDFQGENIKLLSGPLMQAWQEAVAEYFPISKNESKQDVHGESKTIVSDELHLAPEPCVDIAREKKDRELEAYKQKMDRKQRLNAKLE